jgi:hypothetical protein
MKGTNFRCVFLNLNPRLNFSIAYKGLRSEGNYINQLSQGILDLQQVTTQKMSAIFQYHFTSQIFWMRNGGITTISGFEDEDPR